MTSVTPPDPPARKVLTRAEYEEALAVIAGIPELRKQAEDLDAEIERLTAQRRELDDLSGGYRYRQLHSDPVVSSLLWLYEMRVRCAQEGFELEWRPILEDSGWKAPLNDR